MKKFAAILFSVSFLCLTLVIFLLVMPTDEKKADQVQETKLHFNKSFYEQLEKKVITDKKGAIINIERDGKIFDVTVHDDWNKLNETEKKKVTEEIYKKLYNISVASELIKTSGSIDVLLISRNGDELANKDAFGKLKIYK